MVAAILYGGITHHYMASNLPYCNTINGSGSIHNEYVIGLVGSKDSKVGFIKGKDSACGNIFGVLASLAIDENVDFIIGGYNTNFKDFEKLGIIPPSINGVTPLVGLDFKIPIYTSENFSIKIDNLFSIGIITHSISLNF